MLARLVVGRMDPQHIDCRSWVITDELVPGFVASSEPERMGLWMVDRRSGRALELTCWPDHETLDRARVEDAADRARLAELLGLQISASITAEVIGQRRPVGPEDGRAPRWARTTWVSGLTRDHHDLLRALHAQVKALDSPGFLGGCWVADYASGNGMGLSLWADAASMCASGFAVRGFRRHFRRTVPCTIGTVEEYQVIASVPPMGARTIDLAGEATDPAGAQPSSVLR
ncbi:MAG TPA: hypothetical protein VFA11_08855 [Acidimicrobiales bacterium]|nr:hypothetical protein [Acidimicrobiales bacterium]